MTRNLLHHKGPALVGLLVAAQLALAPGAAAATTVGTARPAAPAPVPAAGPPAGACAPVTPTALAGFFDTAVPGRLRRERVPGAVVSVVSGGRTVFARGYGLADVEHGTAFDPDRSLVRIASITKLFTWTAVMQQVQAGRLDLDADVNRYLTGFRVPATYPEPVTLATLMDHTSGFEGQVVGTAARSAADVQPLGPFLAARMPARIRPPGEMSAYSNYGAALAGYVVSRVSGQPYEQYVQDHLFAPLAMTRSTAAEPVPAALAGDLARSYDSDVSPPRRIPFTFDPLTPDGAISTTAGDIAHFMTAQLEQGRYGDGRILDPAGVALMHRRTYAADPRLAGFAHGFMDRTVNGHRVLAHDGSWEGFESVLLLVPGCDLGLFVSANATGGVAALTDVLRAFDDRFLTPVAQPASPVGGPVVAPRAGFYQPARHNESTVEKLTNLLGPMRLTVRSDGALHFKGMRWTAQGGGLYGSADGRDHLVFRAGTGGRFYAATDGAAYQLMDPADTLPVNLAVLAVLAVLGLSAAAVPVAAGWRRLRRRPAARDRLWRTARRLAAAATGLGLVFLALLAATLLGDTSAFLYAVPARFTALLALPVLVLLLGAGALACTVAGWRGPGAGALARTHQVALLLGLVAFTWFVVNWNLLGWQYP